MNTGSAANRIRIPSAKEGQAGNIHITSDEPGAVVSEKSHPGTPIEWWSVRASFEGKKCGCRHLMASLFRYDCPKTDGLDSIGYYLLLSLSDPATGHTEIISRGERTLLERMVTPNKSRETTPIDPQIPDFCFEDLLEDGPPVPVTLEQERPDVREDPFSVVWKDFCFSQEDGKFRLAFDIPGGTFRCSLTLNPVSRRFEIRGMGASSGSPMTIATIPKLELEGSIGDEKISGEAWFDHPWGSAFWSLTRPPEGGLNGWDWAGINSGDGSDWLFLVFHDMKSRSILEKYAIRFEADRRPRVFQDFEAAPVTFRESERTHITYPVGWIFRIPEISAEIMIRPVIEDQEIPLPGFMRAAWEGSATASGTVGKRQITGRAWLCLQGYGYIFDYREFLEPYIRRIHKSMREFFPKTLDNTRYEELAGTPRWLHEPAAYNEIIARPFWDLMSRRKKYWRPIFGMLLLESLGISMDQYCTLIAVAPELTHTGTLIIDDIQDNATTRRGDTCIHTRYGLDVAINAANTLYFLPAALYATHPHLTDRQRLELYQIALDWSVRGHLGQALDIYWTKNLSEKNLASWQADHLPKKMLQMYEFKTASPAIVTAEACSILAGSDERVRNACRDLASSFGVSFQILNDIREFDEKQNGDRCGEDLASGKLTYVIVRAMEMLDNHDRKRLTRIVCSKRLRKNPDSFQEGIGLIRTSGALSATRNEARLMAEEGWQAFSPLIAPSEHKIMLRLFLKRLTNDNGKFW